MTQIGKITNKRLLFGLFFIIISRFLPNVNKGHGEGCTTIFYNEGFNRRFRRILSFVNVGIRCFASPETALILSMERSHGRRNDTISSGILPWETNGHRREKKH